jgi:hexulose-6-phosphate isomerase
MQGRLVPPEAERFQSFPRHRWRDEFAFAARANLDAIEWIYDQYGEDVNPLGTDGGTEELKLTSRQHSVAVVSVCADYFMDRPMVRASDRELQKILEKLHWLLDRCRSAGIERMVLPFVDQSRIENAGETDQVVEVLKAVLPKAEASGVITSSPPAA